MGHLSSLLSFIAGLRSQGLDMWHPKDVVTPALVLVSFNCWLHKSWIHLRIVLIQGSPRSDWPVVMSVGDCLDCWLKWAQPTMGNTMPWAGGPEMYRKVWLAVQCICPGGPIRFWWIWGWECTSAGKVLAYGIDLLFVTMINTTTKSNLGRKGLIWLTLPSHRPSSKENWGTNPRQGLK